jgi:hypothetical protein
MGTKTSKAFDFLAVCAYSVHEGLPKYITNTILQSHATIPLPTPVTFCFKVFLVLQKLCWLVMEISIDWLFLQDLSISAQSV